MLSKLPPYVLICSVLLAFTALAFVPWLATTGNGRYFIAFLAAAGIFERRKGCVFAEHVGGGIEIERCAEAEPLCDLGYDPPIRPGLAGRIEKRALDDREARRG